MTSAVPDPERALAGALLLAETVEEAARLITSARDLEPRHFRHAGAAATWRVACELVRDGKLPDAVSVVHALGKAPMPGSAACFVASLVSGLPRVLNLGGWATLIREGAASGPRQTRAGPEDPDGPDAEREDGTGAGAGLAVEHVSVLRRRHQEREAAGGLRFLWDGIVPDAGVFVGHIGPPKIGKTTLGMLFAHTSGKQGGGELLGRAVLERRVLVLAIEDPPFYTEALADRYFEDADNVWCYTDRLKADPEGIERVVETIKAQNIGLVVLFSLSAFWLVQDENDNAQVQSHGEAIRDAARRSGVPWLLDVHARKAEGFDGTEIRGAAALAGVLDSWISQRRGARRKSEGDEVRYFEVRGRLPHGGLDIAARFDVDAGVYHVIEAEKSLGPDIAVRCRVVAAGHDGRATVGALLKGLGLTDGGKYRGALRKALLADGWRHVEDGARAVWVAP